MQGNFSVHQMGSLVPESESRMLDQRVAQSEMPYGYLDSPPPADTGDFNQRRLESRNESRPKRGR